MDIKEIKKASDIIVKVNAEIFNEIEDREVCLFIYRKLLEIQDYLGTLEEEMYQELKDRTEQ